MGYILANIVRAYQFVLLLKALVSWFPDVANTSLGLFLNQVTEPVLAPVRDFFRRNIQINCPIDLSFLAVYIGLSLIANLLYMI